MDKCLWIFMDKCLKRLILSKYKSCDSVGTGAAAAAGAAAAPVVTSSEV
jgi:hypothetical protein